VEGNLNAAVVEQLFPTTCDKGVMTADFESVLETAFAEVPQPEDDQVVGSYGEEPLEEVAPFIGKKWNDLDPNVVAEHPDALLYWFTPAAFHYYLPAFLKAGWAHPEAEFVFDILQSLEPDEKENLASFTRKRWGRLNDRQVEAVIMWLTAIFPSDSTELQDAVAVLTQRYWQR
jgi:hypothetical protein